MSAIGTLLILIAIGAAVGIAMSRHGRSWLGQKLGSMTSASDLTYALVGIAGSFVGFHLGLVLSLGSEILLYVVAAAVAAVTIFAWRGR